MDFLQHLRSGCVEALRSLPADVRSDTYAVSLFVYDEEDDPWRPTVTVDVNTESRVNFALNASDDERPSPYWVPSSPAEARWNYAFWRQDPIAVLADATSDPAGATLREQWLRDSGQWVDEIDEEAWENQQVTSSFVDMLVAIAQDMHASGLIAELFAESIPVLIHELEYYDEIARQCESANPDGQAATFAAWVRNPE